MHTGGDYGKSHSHTPKCVECHPTHWKLTTWSVCDVFANNCMSTGSSGPGVANTDFLLYVTASDNFCGGSTLAFASHCQLDPDSDR